MSEKITAMIAEIKGLTVLELSELVHALEEVFGVSAAAMAAPAAGAAAPLLRRRPTLTSSWLASMPLPRSRSSRLSARLWVWVWLRPRLLLRLFPLS